MDGSKQEKMFLMVVAYKNFNDQCFEGRDGYHVLLAGSQISKDGSNHPKWIRDDSTEANISEENPYYCELTAQYWAWKKLDTPTRYVGLDHYKRFFVCPRRGSHSLADELISPDQVEKILQNWKAILPFPNAKNKGDSIFYKRKPKEQNWILIEDIIRVSYPDVLPSFEKYIYGKTIIFGNMFITSLDIFRQYSSFLFDVLSQYDLQIEKMGQKRTPKVDGYLSELLLEVWFFSKFKKKDIYYLEVRTSDDVANFEKTGHDNKILFFIRHHRNLLLVSRKIYLLLSILRKKL